MVTRTFTHRSTPMTFILRYPQGNFVVVQSSPELVLQLFLSRNDMEYRVNEHIHSYLSICCTIMLMLGILAVANAQIQLQIAFACAYISLNAAYLAMANTPTRAHWDLSSLEVRGQRINDGGRCNDQEPGYTLRDPWIDYNPTYTQALW